jgi:hypothetical protein
MDENLLLVRRFGVRRRLHRRANVSEIRPLPPRLCALRRDRVRFDEYTLDINSVANHGADAESNCADVAVAEPAWPGDAPTVSGAESDRSDALPGAARSESACTESGWSDATGSESGLPDRRPD